MTPGLWNVLQEFGDQLYLPSGHLRIVGAGALSLIIHYRSSLSLQIWLPVFVWLRVGGGGLKGSKGPQAQGVGPSFSRKRIETWLNFSPIILSSG